jgi:hypothetical protein
MNTVKTLLNIMFSYFYCFDIKQQQRQLCQ